MSKNKITIDKKKYIELLNDSSMLCALESGGVDNWSWYYESLKEYEEVADVIQDDEGRIHYVYAEKEY